MRVLEADVLVVGGGVAGLVAAWQARLAGADTRLLALGTGGSGWLQGVNVALGHADSRDSPDVHAEDLLREGCGVNDPALVRQTVEAARDAFFALQELGVGFAETGGRYLQRHASGSTYPRCCYVPGMMWGPKTAKVLRRALTDLGVVQDRLRLVRVVADNGRVEGAVAVDPRSGEACLVRAPAVVLASGGVGGLYPRSTYPSDVTGSSYAIAHHAGARLADMEFIQFEPLVGFNPPRIRGYVFPTTLFGDGAVLRDRNGKRFLLDGRPQGEAGIGKEELVSRMAAMRRLGRTLDAGGVLLDATDVPAATLQAYPWLSRFAAKQGIDLEREAVEVWPAAHTCLGGILVDRQRQSAVEGLFAAGEAAAGIHGAGRLAGGSGTDVIAGGYLAGRSAAACAGRTSGAAGPDRLARHAGRMLDFEASHALRATRDLQAIQARAAEILGEAAGIERSGEALERGRDEIVRLYEAIRPCGPLPAASPRLAVADRVLVTGMILDAACRRRESRGTHLREDFPAADPAMGRSLENRWPCPRPPGGMIR